METSRKTRLARMQCYANTSAVLQRFFWLMFAAVFVSACVSSSPSPTPPSLASILTPAADDKKPDAADEIENSLSPDQQVATGSPETPKKQPAVAESALAPKKTEPTPTEAAATKLAEAKTEQEPEKVASVATKTDAAKEADKKAEEQLKPKTPEPTNTAPTKPTNSGNSFFSNLFKNNTNSRPAPSGTTRTTKVTNNRARPRVRVRKNNGGSALPGVRTKGIFGIDTDDTEELDEPVKVASVTNRARRGTHGLLLQRKGVQVGCFPRRLVRLLKQVERRFGRTPIVTSGFRSRAYNRRIRGARNSMHIYCKAADIQVQGVSKWRLAKYMRSLPGRGGVGTYCHTKSVHIDIGKKRDWNRRCRRSRTKRRR